MKKTITVLSSRLDFAERLRVAAQFTNCADSPTAMANGFNQRFPQLSVTSHAVRKWLVGDAIPKQENLVALAEWLDVDPAWLRFGDAHTPASTVRVAQHRDGLERDIALLTPAERIVARAAVDAILIARQKANRSQ